MSWAEDEMVQGYMDGRNPDNPEPSANRSRSYRHGFQSGRDDLAKKLSAPFEERIRQAEEALKADMEAYHGA
ncbi:MAG TPA: hypothetical protein VGQ19_21110 [Burkholderiales bacterium]|jgi:hypothetical protein|nr:hypothetical protein [Burkholderiales bacterium]